MVAIFVQKKAQKQVLRVKGGERGCVFGTDFGSSLARWRSAKVDLVLEPPIVDGLSRLTRRVDTPTRNKTPHVNKDSVRPNYNSPTMLLGQEKLKQTRE
ncbi:hypothetical protein Hanom_Chr05g00420941 [Helianthus anomalus]